MADLLVCAGEGVVACEGAFFVASNVACCVLAGFFVLRSFNMR